MSELPDWAALPEEPSCPALKAYFDVVKPGITTKEKVELGKKPSMIFGRNPDTTDVCMEHPSISRRHAAIVFNAKGEIFVMDFGSTHGTFLDGKKLVGRQATLLENGSRIKFAESSRTYVLRLPSSSLSAAAAAAAASNGRSTEQKDSSFILDKEALHQLPLAFGGPPKGGGGGGGGAAAALNKDAMSAGIAEMMKQIEDAEKKRNEEEKKQGDGNDDEEEEDDDDDMGPRPPPPTSSSSAPPASKHEKPKKKKLEVSVEEALSNEPEDLAKRFEVPMSHEANLRGHYKSITCIAMDPSGSRAAIGGMDYKLFLYDFGGMDRTHKPFRELEPEEGNPVIAVSWSTTGDRFICATGSAQAKIFDRDGLPLQVFVKGDPYIADMAQTKGHTMALTAAQWHPMERDTVMTASIDGTVRLWDLNGPTAFDKLTCKKVIKARSQRSTKVPVSCAVFSPAADYVAAGAQDGSIQIFSLRKTSWMKPDILMRPGHASDSHVTAVAFAPDGKTLVSRATDNSIRLWDIRKPQKPLKVIDNVTTYFDSANVAFSPDGKLICCGTNVKRGEGTGTLKFWEVASPSTEPILQMGIAPEAGVTHVVWHRRLKQILCGSSAGATKVLYDPAFSTKGALMSSTRVKRAKDPSDFSSTESVVGKIINPSALPMYREERIGQKRKKEKERMDPIKSKKPDMPMNGPGFQGRVSGQSNFTQYVMQNTKKKNTLLEEDPREAILKYAESSKEGTQLVGRAYAKTAPVTPFLAKTLEQEMEDMKKMEEDILKK